MGRPPKQPAADHAQAAYNLAARPYEWGTIRVYPTAYEAEDVAGQIQTARNEYRVYGPVGYFETRTTPVEDGTRLEARYIGGTSKPRRLATIPTADLIWADVLTVLSPPTSPNGTP